MSPEAIVRQYLDAMERRDLAAARELPDGSPYSGIRFIDRFTVRAGTLVDQNVWNDMAEVLGEKLTPL